MTGSVVLNARFVTQPMTGVQRAAYEIGRRIAATRNDVVALSPGQPRAEYALDATIYQPLPVDLHGHVWEQVALRRVAKNAGVTIGLGGTAPIHVRARQLVMIYDVNYIDGPLAYSPRFRRAYTTIQRWLARHVQICTISYFSARRIAACFDIPQSRIAVVPMGADHILAVPSTPDSVREVRRQYDLSDRPFILCVGSANPNKNFAGAVAGYLSIDKPAFDLVIVGGGDSRVFAAGANPADTPGLRRLGFVTDAVLCALYESAAGFLMPSFLEGFGIPALEAMLLGCPVLAADAAALPEVCGDAALYFDPNDPRAIGAAMARLAGDPHLRADYAGRGLERAASFTWDSSAGAFDQLIDLTLADRDFAMASR